MRLGRDRAKPYSTPDFMCALVSLPDLLVWERDYVYTCVQHLKMVSYATDRNRRAENGLIDQGEFVAMKTLSGCKVLCCDKHQFRDKMTVST